MTWNGFFVIVGITLVAIAGVACGVLAVFRGTWLRHLLAVSAGLLTGMSTVLILPEALSSGKSVPVMAAFAMGFFLFGALEWALHSRTRSPHSDWVSALPVFIAMSVHSALDGWNTAVAVAVHSSGTLGFIAGMGLHKLTGGFAVGAVFRALAPTRNQALLLASLAEATTLAGGAGYGWLNRVAGSDWTLLLLAATGGSLLFLGAHTFERARQHSGHTAAGAAVLGFAAILGLAFAG